MMRSSKRPIARRLRLALLSAVWAIVSLSSPATQAHERFVLHRLKVPLQNDFFTRSLMQNPDMSRIGVNVALVLLAFLVIGCSASRFRNLQRSASSAGSAAPLSGRVTA
jgi:hypothetical protein